MIHSLRRILISVSSQAPANDGAGQGMNLGCGSGTSGLEDDVEGLFSVWK